jgi:hypothetical protein
MLNLNGKRLVVSLGPLCREGSAPIPPVTINKMNVSTATSADSNIRFVLCPNLIRKCIRRGGYSALVVPDLHRHSVLN